MRLTVLNPFDKQQDFPNPDLALREPDGLLAVGGCLSPERLTRAYRRGIFPWYNAGEPILWWSPDPRLIIRPGEVKISRSLQKLLQRGPFEISFDRDFPAVIQACAQPRPGATGTWITPEIKRAYIALHHRGLAHSVEAWEAGELVGGVYGVAIGRVFFGESMFYRRSNASKVAFATLCQALQRWNYALIDCQVRTEHLISLGAKEIPRGTFLELLNVHCEEAPDPSAWQNRD